eukprot:g10219.t1
MCAETSDTILILERAADGDSEALSELWDRYRERLRRLVRLRLDRRLQGRIDASDVLQEAFIDFANRAQEFVANPKMPFFLWLRFLTGQRLQLLHRHHLGAQMRDAGREVSLHRGAMPQATSVSLAAQLLGRFTIVNASESVGPVEILTEEFLERRRNGERPSIDEYCERIPELADVIRNTLEALLLVEDMKPDSKSDSADSYENFARGDRPERIADYRIIREIGRGGMGVVYEAEQESLRRRVALKVLPPGVSSDEKGLARFQREAQAAAALHHTNIVPVFDVGQEGDISYYAMQFIPGQGLDAVYEEIRSLRAGQAPVGVFGDSISQSLWRGGLDADAELRPLKAQPPPDADPNEPLEYLEDEIDEHGLPVASETQETVRAVDGRPVGALPPNDSSGGRSTVRVALDETNVSLPGDDRSSSGDTRHTQYFRSIARIGRQIADAIGYAHSRGTVHRDIKPANLLLDTNGVVWVADFGLAKTEDAALTHTGDILGTLRYMSPERFQSVCDHRGDIYALGVTLYELLSLQPAFQSADRLELIDKIAKHEPVPLRALDPHIPRDLETIVAKAMAKEPEKRYQTAGELAEDLRRFLCGEPIVARRVGMLERTIKWTRRHPAVAVAVLFFVLGSFGVAWKWKEANDANRSLTVSEQVAKDERDESQRREARNQFRMAIEQCEQGHVVDGVARLLASLKTFPRNSPGFKSFDRTVRTNLASWTQRIHQRQEVFDHPDEVNEAAFSPNGQLLATACRDGCVRIFQQTADGRSFSIRPVQTLRRPDDVPNRSVVRGLYCVAFSADGRFIAAGTWNGAVIWNIENLRMPRVFKKLIGHWEVVHSVDFSPDGELLLTGGRDRTVRLWKIPTSEQIGEPLLHNERVAQGDRLLAGYADGSARLLRLTTTGGVLRLEPTSAPVNQGASITSVCVSADCKEFITLADDESVRVWPIVEPVTADLETLSLELEVLTGRAMNSDNEVLPLTVDQWRQRREEWIGTRRGREMSIGIQLDNTEWHRRCASDAERHDDWFAARWHLDKLAPKNLKSLPNLLRRARFHAQQRDLAQAGAEYERAISLTSKPNRLSSQLSWYSNGYHDSRIRENWQVARWYLDRLIALESKNPRWYEYRARIHGELGQTEGQDSDLIKAAQLTANPLRFWETRAYKVARKGEWKWAEMYCLKAVAIDPRPIGARYLLALLYLRSGNLDSYRELCRRLVDAWSDIAKNSADDAGQSERTRQFLQLVGICASGPCRVEDAQTLLKHLESNSEQLIKFLVQMQLESSAKKQIAIMAMRRNEPLTKQQLDSMTKRLIQSVTQQQLAMMERSQRHALRGPSGAIRFRAGRYAEAVEQFTGLINAENSQSADHTENAVKKFINQFNEKISGVISCFDRMLFKGYLPLGWSGAMERLLAQQGLLIKDFKQFVMKHSHCIKTHAEALAARHERPFLYLNGRIRKEELVRNLAEQDGITEGLVCVLRTVEPCQSFQMVPGEGRPRLVNATRKCLCFYYYFIDREFGLMHVRIQSWFPLVIQICLNGHEWLARKLDAHGIEYRKQDNAFLWIGDCRRAQKFADRFAKKNWPHVLAAFARRVNPLLSDVLAGMEYYWVMDQAEYATDVMFESCDALKDPYEQLLKHATLCFGAEDVLTFLGRKLHGSFRGEVLTDTKKKRFPGARVKHRMKENWIKMYDKHGCVLRVETVINNPREFKIRRHGKRQGEVVLDWFPMAKGVANMPRYREVALAANRRYLDALSTVEQPGDSRKRMRRLAQPVRTETRSHRGLNPARQDDVELMAAVLCGEHTIRGFTNADIRANKWDQSEKRNPEQSLLLLKATARIPHGGGRRLQPGSEDYRRLASWIRQGAQGPRSNDPVLVQLTIQPEERIFQPNSQQRLKVVAKYSGGIVRDVTSLAVYESNDPDIAGVDENGLVSAKARGGLFSVMVRFGDKFGVLHGTVPFKTKRQPAGFVAPKAAELSDIDQFLVTQWKELGIAASGIADDATFIRRVTIDICGTLPTAEEVTHYVNNRRADKRARLIDRLLERPEYAAYFSLKWAAILKNRGRGYSTRKQRAGTALFSSWIRDSIAANKPYDQFVSEILTATGSQRDNPPAIWYRSVRTSQDYVESIAQAFLGVRIQCAQCHHHPAERWSQADYYSLAAVFARIGRKGGFADAEVPTNEIIYLKDRGEIVHPRTGKIMKPRALGGRPFALSQFDDPRRSFAKWMTAKDNPFFARTMVNRMWGHFFGRGIIHPIDDARSTNPPSNPRLLAALSRDFADNGYDVKRLIRIITNSYAYRLSARPNQSNRDDTQSFARFYPRRLTGEVLLDGISQVLAVPTKFPGGPGTFPQGTRAIDLPDENVPINFLDVFGRPARTSACECERTDAPALSQALELVNSKEIQRKLTAKDGFVQKLITNRKSDHDNVRNLFLRTLGRPPKPFEMKAAITYLQGEPDRGEGYRSLTWSLLATNEFLFNH